MNEKRTIGTLADVRGLIEQAGLTGTRRRDMVSAINRICEMAGTTPACVSAEPPVLKEMLSHIRPAAHGVSVKSYSNLRSLFAAALQLAGVIDRLAGVAPYATPYGDRCSKSSLMTSACRTGSPPSQTGAPVRTSHRRRSTTRSFSDS